MNFLSSARKALGRVVGGATNQSNNTDNHVPQDPIAYRITKPLPPNPPLSPVASVSTAYYSAQNSLASRPITPPQPETIIQNQQQVQASPISNVQSAYFTPQWSPAPTLPPIPEAYQNHNDTSNIPRTTNGRTTPPPPLPLHGNTNPIVTSVLDNATPANTNSNSTPRQQPNINAADVDIPPSIPSINNANTPNSNIDSNPTRQQSTNIPTVNIPLSTSAQAFVDQNFPNRNIQTTSTNVASSGGESSTPAPAPVAARNTNNNITLPTVPLPTPAHTANNNTTVPTQPNAQNNNSNTPIVIPPPVPNTNNNATIPTPPPAQANTNNNIPVPTPPALINNNNNKATTPPSVKPAVQPIPIKVAANNVSPAPAPKAEPASAPTVAQVATPAAAPVTAKPASPKSVKKVASSEPKKDIDISEGAGLINATKFIGVFACLAAIACFGLMWYYVNNNVAEPLKSAYLANYAFIVIPLLFVAFLSIPFTDAMYHRFRIFNNPKKGVFILVAWYLSIGTYIIADPVFHLASEKKGNTIEQNLYYIMIGSAAALGVASVLGGIAGIIAPDVDVAPGKSKKAVGSTGSGSQTAIQV